MRLTDLPNNPTASGSPVVWGHSHLDESVQPEPFSRTLWEEKEAYLGRHSYLQHVQNNFFDLVHPNPIGVQEQWLLGQATWPISNPLGLIEPRQTDFPGFNGTVGSGDAGLQAIAAGTYDAQIEAAASALAELDAIFIRPWREMNGNWTPWYTPTPGRFIAAWRRMHDIFKAICPQHAIVWCAAFSGSSDHTGAAWYPGDSYVDWVGPDGYRSNPHCYDFATLFQAAHAIWGPKGTNPKPMMVCETAPAPTTGVTGPNSTPDPQTWLSQIPVALEALPGIRAVCFWEEDTHPLTIPEGASSATEVAYREIIAAPYLSASPITMSPSRSPLAP